MAETKISRRDFLKVGAVAGAVMAGAVLSPEDAEAAGLQNRDLLLNDQILKLVGIEVNPLLGGVDWRTKGKLDQTEKQHGSREPQLSQLLDKEGRIVGYKLTLFPISFVGSIGAYVSFNYKSGPYATREFGWDYLNRYMDWRQNETKPQKLVELYLVEGEFGDSLVKLGCVNVEATSSTQVEDTIDVDIWFFRGGFEGNEEEEVRFDGFDDENRVKTFSTHD